MAAITMPMTAASAMATLADLPSIPSCDQLVIAYDEVLPISVVVSDEIQTKLKKGSRVLVFTSLLQEYLKARDPDVDFSFVNIQFVLANLLSLKSLGRKGWSFVIPRDQEGLYFRMSRTGLALYPTSRQFLDVSALIPTLHQILAEGENEDLLNSHIQVLRNLSQLLARYSRLMTMAASARRLPPLAVAKKEARQFPYRVRSTPKKARQAEMAAQE
jgi:hypothetical protein